MRQALEISHDEVRRHPIWQREARSSHQVDKPHGIVSPRERFLLATLVGAVVVAIALVTVNG